jgi:hypothetical protein
LKNYMLSLLKFIIWSWNLLKQTLWHTRTVLAALIALSFRRPKKYLCFGMIDLDIQDQ